MKGEFSVFGFQSFGGEGQEEGATLHEFSSFLTLSPRKSALA
jgi:hypothetical protein